MRIRSTAFALTTLILAAALFAHHGPKTVKIDAAQKKQPAVTFNHELHATKHAKSCDTCHHTQKGLKSDEGTKVVKCSTCHLDPKDPAKIPSMREMSLTKNPLHVRCIDCHKEQKKGPTACATCHKKA